MSRDQDLGTIWLMVRSNLQQNNLQGKAVVVCCQGWDRQQDMDRFHGFWYNQIEKTLAMQVQVVVAVSLVDFEIGTSPDSL